MKTCFRILLAVVAQAGFTTFTALAHPGSGIVVDAQGRVYFSEAGDPDAHLPGIVCQIDAQGKLQPNGTVITGHTRHGTGQSGGAAVEVV